MAAAPDMEQFPCPPIRFVMPNASRVVGEFDGVIAVQHGNGYVGLYTREDDVLTQVSDRLVKSVRQTGEELAAHLFGIAPAA